MFFYHAKRRDGTFINYLRRERCEAIHIITATPMINIVGDLTNTLQLLWDKIFSVKIPSTHAPNPLLKLYSPKYDPEEEGKGLFVLYHDSTTKIVDIMRNALTSPTGKFACRLSTPSGSHVREGPIHGMNVSPMRYSSQFSNLSKGNK